jgi:uncharacterized protein (DUF779 family)
VEVFWLESLEGRVGKICESNGVEIVGFRKSVWGDSDGVTLFVRGESSDIDKVMEGICSVVSGRVEVFSMSAEDGGSDSSHFLFVGSDEEGNGLLIE